MSYDFTLERVIDATPDELFDALLDPEGQEQWWGGPGEIVRTSCDLRIGGKAVIEWGPKGRLMRAEQTFLEIDRPHRIVYTETVVEPDSPTYECVLTFTFEAVEGKTHMKLVHTGFPSEEERDKHQRGTGIFLDRLEGHLGRLKGVKQ